MTAAAVGPARRAAPWTLDVVRDDGTLDLEAWGRAYVGLVFELEGVPARAATLTSPDPERLA